MDGRPEQLDLIKEMINTGDRSAAIIRTAIAYPADFWDYMKTIKKCDGLIYSTDEYAGLVGHDAWIKRRRAKIICDFLIFWSKTDNRGPINEIIDDIGNLREGAYATIQTQIANDIAQLKSLHGQLKNAIADAGANVNALMEQIKIKSMQLFAFAAFAADSVSVACKSAGGAAVDTASATVAVIDQLLGQLLQFDIITGIDIPATARASNDFLTSIAGEHTDTIILMLEGLLTVCAGTVAVKNYDAVFDRILKILNEMEGLIRVGVASTILYGIGTVMELLSKKLAAEKGDKLIMLKNKSTQIAEISRRTRNTDGTDVDAATIFSIRDEIIAVVEGDAQVEEGALTAENEERAAALTAAEERAARAARAAEERAAAERAAAEEEQAAARAAALAAAGEARAEARAVEESNPDIGHHGGKKHAKSQKKPRKKASKSKRSKKAGKKTRKKSRGKSRGKKH